MQYIEVEAEVRRLAETATHVARLAFAADSIRILREKSASASADELVDREKVLLNVVLADLFDGEPMATQSVLDELLQTMTSDELRAVEFDPDITELLCVADAILKYRASGDPKEIVRIGISVINSVDHAIGGDSASYSIGNMLGDPRMVGEIARQRRILSAEQCNPA